MAHVSVASNGSGSLDVTCHDCGNFAISGTLAVTLPDAPYTQIERARISHGLRRAGGESKLNQHSLDALLAATMLPSASDLRDNLLLYVANKIAGPGEEIEIYAPELRATIGAYAASGVRWAFEQAVNVGFLVGSGARTMDGDDRFRSHGVTLTARGWERVEELLRSARDSKRCFMAMKFGNAELDTVFRNHFKPAVKQTGFDLMRLDEQPEAGLIDDRLRLEIRRSRFMIADLSHANAGAYWEAGFAEGLGRPVIYTCRKDVFDDPKSKPHFDTNHHLTVIWDPANPDVADEQLKTVIRATLPADALLDDPE